MRPSAAVALIASAVVLLGARPASQPPESDVYRIRVASADPLEPQAQFRLIGARGHLGPEDMDGEGELGDTVMVHVGTTLTLRRGEGRVRIESVRGGPWLRVELLTDESRVGSVGPFVTREFEIHGDSLWFSNRFLPDDPQPPVSDTP